MKTAIEWVNEDAGRSIYQNHTESILLVQRIQQDAYLAGLSKAREIVTDYAKAMRGSHVNTNGSCGVINKDILAEMDRVKSTNTNSL